MINYIENKCVPRYQLDFVINAGKRNECIWEFTEMDIFIPNIIKYIFDKDIIRPLKLIVAF